LRIEIPMDALYELIDNLTGEERKKLVELTAAQLQLVLINRPDL